MMPRDRLKYHEKNMNYKKTHQDHNKHNLELLKKRKQILNQKSK